MTAKIPTISNRKNISEEFQKRIDHIITTKWQLNNITETGIITDEANFDNVEIVFSQYHIYALYGNRVDKFKYRFLTKNTFSVNIENVDVKCRIKELSNKQLIFHADFRNAHFILELEATH
ncbi:MAG TPA: hypothetical protein ENK64_02055 [Flavobacteriales bacterium]|nr:hypothetical protein [Flavobacteriales bacterium]